MRSNRSQPRSTRSGNFPAGYQPKERLGEGSEGEVWVLHDVYLAKTVIGKQLQPGRFHNNIEGMQATMALAAAVKHVNVAEATNVVPDERGTFWLMSPYTEGVDLEHLLSQRALTDHEILQVLLDVARGLDAISIADIVHGDLSARNVIVGPNGSSKITDFGLACRVADPTHSGGTPGYMAPEKSKKGEALSSLDVFSFGSLISRMLTGKTPRLLKDARGNSLLETIKLPEDAPALRKELCSLANRAIDPDPDKRPGTALLLHNLEVLAAGASEEGRDQLAENISQLMAERRVDAVLEPIEERKVSLWRRWGSFTVSVVLLFIAGASGLVFYTNPNLPVVHDVAIEMDLSVTPPNSFSAEWVHSQIAEGVQDRWADWDIFDTESLQMEILCQRSLCELLLRHADRRGSHVHVTSISSGLAVREDVWQGAIRDLVYLAAAG